MSTVVMQEGNRRRIKTQGGNVSTYPKGMQIQMPSGTKQVGNCVSGHGKTFGNGGNTVRVEGAYRLLDSHTPDVAAPQNPPA